VFFLQNKKTLCSQGGQYAGMAAKQSPGKGVNIAGMSAKIPNQRGVNYPEQGVSFTGMGGQFKPE